MVIADTGYFLALANRRDRHHERAREKSRELSESLVTTWPVLTETCHLLLARLSVVAQLRFIDAVARGAVEVFSLEAADFPRVRELMEAYQELPMDLADASLVILAERLGHGRILSTDERDFRTYRFKRHKPFENLLLD
jgi:predicted nucleic acid-binding protein